MATDFGFEASKKDSGYYFISYNTEDSKRIADICMRLHNAGMDMWYDGGLKHGEKWDSIISKKIYNCKEYIFFLTKGIIEKAQKVLEQGDMDSENKIYIKLEFDKAKTYKKNKNNQTYDILIVYLDDIDDATVPPEISTWWLQNFSFSSNTNLQGVDARKLSDEETANAILKELNFKSVASYLKAKSAGAAAQKKTPESKKETPELILDLSYLATDNDKKAAQAIIKEIDQLFPISQNSDVYISKVRSHYNELTDFQKRFVTNYKDIEKAESDFNKKAAQTVIEEINRLFPVNHDSDIQIEKVKTHYNQLTDSQKKLVTNYKDLEKAEKKIKEYSLATENDKKIAHAVSVEINQLFTINRDSGFYIRRARNHYNKLTDIQKKYVTNYKDIEKAESDFNKKAAQTVIEEINRLFPVNHDSVIQIEKVKTHYNQLTDSQKKLVTNYKNIEKAEDDNYYFMLNEIIQDSKTDHGEVPLEKANQLLDVYLMKKEVQDALTDIKNFCRSYDPSKIAPNRLGFAISTESKYLDVSDEKFELCSEKVITMIGNGKIASDDGMVISEILDEFGKIEGKNDFIDNELEKTGIMFFESVIAIVEEKKTFGDNSELSKFLLSIMEKLLPIRKNLEKLDLLTNE